MVNSSNQTRWLALLATQLNCCAEGSRCTNRADCQQTLLAASPVHFTVHAALAIAAAAAVPDARATLQQQACTITQNSLNSMTDIQYEEVARLAMITAKRISTQVRDTHP